MNTVLFVNATFFSENLFLVFILVVVYRFPYGGPKINVFIDD